jgi:hypothetical protein
MAERMDTCGFCRFYKSLGEAAGLCRRHAPAVMDRAWDHPEYGLQSETATHWPDTRASDWCGDFEAGRGQ